MCLAPLHSSLRSLCPCGDFPPATARCVRERACETAVDACETPVHACETPVHACGLAVCSCETPIYACGLAVCACETPVHACETPVHACGLAVCSCETPVDACETPIYACGLAVCAGWRAGDAGKATTCAGKTACGMRDSAFVAGVAATAWRGASGPCRRVLAASTGPDSGRQSRFANRGRRARWTNHRRRPSSRCRGPPRVPAAQSRCGCGSVR